MKTFTKTLFLLVLMIMSSAGAWADVAEVWFHGAKQGSYDAFYEAIDKANNLTTDVNNRATVKLLCDATANQHKYLRITEDDAYVSSGKYIIFDGNGHTLTITENNKFNVYGSLTVTGGTITGNISVYYTNAGCTLNVTGGTIIGDITVYNGTANISGGSVNGKISITAAAGKEGTLNVTGGTVNGYILVNSGTANVSCGTIDGGSNTGGAINATAGYINISGGEIKGAEYAVKSENTNSGAVRLSGGLLTKGSVGALYMSTDVSNALVGSRFYVQDSNNEWVRHIPASDETKIDQTVKIVPYGVQVWQGSELKVTYTSDDPLYDAWSYIDKSMTTSATNPAVIKLLSDVVCSKDQSFTQQSDMQIVFEGGQYTLSLVKPFYISTDFTVKSGTIKANWGDAYENRPAVFRVNSGKLIVDGGTIDASGTKSNAISVTGNCNLTVNGGEFIGGTLSGGSYGAYALKCENTNVVVLNGGTFTRGNDGSLYLNQAVSNALGTGKMLYAGNKLYTGNLTATTISESVSVKDPTAFTVTAGTNGYTTCSQNYNFTVGDGVKVFKAAAPENSTVTMDEVSGIIPANAGVIFKADAANADITITPTFETSTADMNGNKLVAVKSGDTSWASGTNYVLMSNGTETKFFQVSGTLDLSQLAGKCYLNVSGGNARSLDIDWGEGETTGVSQLSTLSSQPKDGKYIENGHIFIMKNGMKYNTAGQRTF